MAAVSAGTWAIATSGFGTASDPLITLSYIDNKLTPDILAKFQKQLDTKSADLTTDLQKRIEELEANSGSNTFRQVSLQNGQSISCSAGAEVLLRSGSLQAWSDLSSLSGGGTLKQGEALRINYMYMIPNDGGGFGAAEASTLLIRGSYKIN